MNSHINPPKPMSAATLLLHLDVLIEDPGDVFARHHPDWLQVADRPVMLRQGDHLEPLVQSGIHQGHIFVETWASFEQRLLTGDRQ